MDFASEFRRRRGESRHFAEFWFELGTRRFCEATLIKDIRSTKYLMKLYGFSVIGSWDDWHDEMSLCEATLTMKIVSFLRRWLEWVQGMMHRAEDTLAEK